MFKEYQDYIKDNPKGYWFKAKLYGWGWTPVRWQGWAVIGVYVVAILLLSLTLDTHASLSDVIFTFFIPIVLLLTLLIYVCYKTGEPPRWQWGPKKK